jgi:inosose dehydratase
MLTSNSRRKFLKTVAAGAAATAASFGVPQFLKAAEGNDKYGGFLMGIQSYSLRNFPLDKTLAITHDDLGLRQIEFFSAHVPLNYPDDKIDALREKLAGLEMKSLAHGVNGFTKNHEANRTIFEFAKKAGIKNLSADPTEDSFDSLDKLVEEFDIRIAIHNHGPGSRYSKVADVLNAISSHHKNIGACADLGHYIRSAEDPVKAIYLLEGRLYGIHLKDFAEQKANAKGVILGKGQLDMEGVFKALRKVNFPADGSLALEYEEKPNDPIADIQECLAVAAETAQKTARG